MLGHAVAAGTGSTGGRSDRAIPPSPSGRWIAWGGAILGLGVLVLLTVVGVQAGVPAGGVAGGLVVAALCWPVAIIAYRGSYLGPVLTSSQLLIPGSFSGWIQVDLSQVTGVGMRFYFNDPRVATPDSWHPYLWLDDQPRIAIPTTDEDTGNQGLLDRHADIDATWRRVAGTAQGRATQRLNDQVLALQGPDGPLAERRQESAPDPDHRQDVAFWSPNGSMGFLRKKIWGVN